MSLRLSGIFLVLNKKSGICLPLLALGASLSLMTHPTLPCDHHELQWIFSLNIMHISNNINPTQPTLLIDFHLLHWITVQLLDSFLKVESTNHLCPLKLLTVDCLIDLYFKSCIMLDLLHALTRRWLTSFSGAPLLSWCLLIFSWMFLQMSSYYYSWVFININLFSMKVLIVWLMAFFFQEIIYKILWSHQILQNLVQHKSRLRSFL